MEWTELMVHEFVDAWCNLPSLYITSDDSAFCCSCIWRGCVACNFAAQQVAQQTAWCVISLTRRCNPLHCMSIWWHLSSIYQI